MTTLQAITLSEEDIALLQSLREVLRLMYDKYFSRTNAAADKNDNLLKRLFRFLKDFEIAPYLLNTKTVFMIYYFTAASHCRPMEQ